MKAPLPPDEAGRLLSLRQYDVLDTPAEIMFDDLTLLAAQICQSPIALVSLVDDKRQWFKSKIGISAEETSRDIAFCAHTILHKNEVFEVCDAQADQRFADNPLVTADPHIRFYAGAPLVAPDGHALGTLCVMDRTPRKLNADQLAALQALSRQVVAQLEMQRQARDLSNQTADRQWALIRLGQQFNQLSAIKKDDDRLLALADKSRRALLSVLEDEKQAGLKLRESEERFRQLAENIREVFWITDPHMREILYVSPAYEVVWGRSCESLRARPHEWLEAIHQEDVSRILEAVAGVPATGVYDVEFRILWPDKTVRWIHDRGFPVRNAAGEIYRIVGTAMDITERKKLEDQIRQSQKMEGIGQLAGGVAHDFNNILAIIQMQSELLKGSGGLSAEQSVFADEIGVTVRRAAALTRQLLLFSRREMFQPRDLDWNESVVNTAKLLKRILGENIEMKVKLPSQSMMIHADAGMMDQILLNLAVNARDAMPGGGQLDIEIANEEFDETAVAGSPQKRAGSFVCLSVRDSGSGIPPEILPKIFEPFFTTKAVGHGTGLGLATVFGIVQQHQGWIDVISEAGRGSTFKIYIPRLAKNADVKMLPATLAAAYGGEETILLVEDDPSLRVSVRMSLTKLGYRILEASTGVQAIEVWKQNRDHIRLLLTDLMMPDGMTGRDLAHHILQHDSKMKVIYMSGYSTDVVGKDFPLTEEVNFLTKPFQAYKLAQTVRKSLDTTT